MNNAKLLAFFYVISWPLRAMDTPILEQQEWGSIHQISQQILALCPPTTCVVIGVGQSPTPFMAYLQTKQPDYAFSVPLSNFRHGLQSDELDQEDLKRLYAHFQQFLPSKNTLAQRSVMLLDYVATKGESILAASRYIERYFRDTFSSQQPKLKITVVRSNSNKHIIPFRFNHIINLDHNSKLLASLSAGKYKPHSPYGDFYVKDEGSHAVPAISRAYKLLQGLITNLIAHQKSPEAANITNQDFVITTQSGTLDHDFLSAQKAGLTEWYINQLKYYQGNDSKDRFQAAFADPEGKSYLIKYWDLFSFKPQQQEKILEEMLKIRNDTQLENLISNIDTVAFSIRPPIIKSLLSVVGPLLRAQFEFKASILGADFADVFLEIYQENAYKGVADRMLDHYLMPEIILAEANDNFALWQTHIVHNFNKLLQEPKLKNIVIEKFHSYRDEKLWLPNITVRAHNHEETMNNVTISRHQNLHKFYRGLLINSIEEVIKARGNN